MGAATDGLIYRYDYAQCTETTDVVLVAGSALWPARSATTDAAGVAWFKISTSFEPRTRLYEVPGTPPVVRTLAQEQFVLALDQGTTSSRAIMFDQAGNIHRVAQRDRPRRFAYLILIIYRMTVC